MSVVPSTVATLTQMAGELLLVAEDALTDTVAGAPGRSYVAPAEPSFDCCPFLTVHVTALGEATTTPAPGGLSTSQRTRHGNVILATFVTIAVRCAPESNANSLPSLVAIEDVAGQVQQDGWSLWNRLRQAIRDGEIFGLCQEVYFDGGETVPEQGGCVGWRFTIRASIPGIVGEGS